jgi:hypothetical protein
MIEAVLAASGFPEGVEWIDQPYPQRVEEHCR